MKFHNNKKVDELKNVENHEKDEDDVSFQSVEYDTIDLFKY